MSGIVTVLHLDGRPVDNQLLHRLTQSMAFRGPDAQTTRLLGHVGLGHTLLRTTFESEHETQPATLDGEVWITADARVDDRAELERKLTEKGRSDLVSATDCELILHAYDAWGRACVEHLLGDFAFVVWDRRRSRLFCARDQIGVKPLFYAHLGRTLVVGNTLDTLRLHPEVSNVLNELAIADFLLFPFEQDSDATDFEDIKRLPPAHTLTWEQDVLSIERYWSLPEEGTLRYRNDQDYIDHFHSVAGQAVGDRLRCHSVAINMSGGLDSTTIAAIARKTVLSTGRTCKIKAFTGVADLPTPDEERPWAQMVANHLRIPIQFTKAEDYASPFADAGARTGESMAQGHARAIAEHARVLLTGLGGDPINRGSSRCYVDQLRKLEVGHLIDDVRKTIAAGKRPPLQVRTLWRHWRKKRLLLKSYPDWINSDFETRLDLRSRWYRIYSQVPVGWSARDEIVDKFWPWMFGNQDPGVTKFPIEYRHPFFDLRLVRFMVRVPTLPWFLGKVLMRKAMRGSLPEPVLARPKGFGRPDPEDVQLRAKSREWWLARLNRGPGIERFVDIGRFLDAVDPHSDNGGLDFDQLTRPTSLASWLQREAE